MLKIIHPIAGTITLLMISSFWLSTVLAEIFAEPAIIALVKTLIPWGFLILIPALAVAGGSGSYLSGKRRGPVIEAKKKRMPLIAANGVFILIPSALYLSFKAQAGVFDIWFYTIQAVELFAGACNITLLCLNMRDGLRLAGRKT